VKRLCIILVGVVMVWGLPGADSARGFPGMDGTPALRGLPAGYPSNVACTGSGPGIMGGYGVNLGWLEQRDGSIWALERQTSTGTATWPLKGFWVQATEELTFDRRFGLLVTTGFFIPRRMSGTWISRPSGATFGFDIPSYDWQFVDGIIKAGVSGGFDILAGFRWDRTSTRVDYSDNTSDDYVLNSYLPLIGAQVNRRFSDSSLLVRFIGSPLVYGTLKYHYWDRLGYAEFGDFRVNSKSSYFEILADYRFKLQSGIRAGGFVKWNWLRVRTDSHNLSGLTTESVAWAVDIKSWVIGGIVSVDFGSPF
jgi:hypothetical protein